MIVHESAKDRSSIFTYKGKYLCSRVDPRLEAKKWVAKISDELLYADTVVVLGVGAGYHLVELTQTHPHLIVIAIDIDSLVVEACKNLHSIELASIHFVLLPEVGELPLNAKIEKLLKSPFQIIQFHPACSYEDKHFEQLKQIFTARSPLGLRFLFRHRKDFIFLQQHVLRPADQRQALSIQSIQLPPPQLCKEESWAIIKMLKELVV